MSFASSAFPTFFLKLLPAIPVQEQGWSGSVAIAARWSAPSRPDRIERGERVGADDGAHLGRDLHNRRDVLDLERDFDALFKRYEQRIYNLALQMVGNEDDASDIVVETFLSASRSRGSFRGESLVTTWLFRIAMNHSKNRMKSRQRLREHEGLSLDTSAESSDGDESSGLLESGLVADWSGSPELLMERSELRDKVHEAIDSLAYEYKSVLILRELEDMSYNDIAEATGITLEAVKTRILRARAMVRRKVAPYYTQD